jgi:uroporphyrinogen-III decarboxylase
MSFGTPPAVEFMQGRSTADRPFVPIVGTLAAAINQVPPEQFHSDATHLANGLQRAQRLFDLDVVCVGVNPALLAEALGATVEWADDDGRFATTAGLESVADLAEPTAVPDLGRVPVAVDAAERLDASTDDDVAVFGVLPGPFTTAEATFVDRTGVEWPTPVRTATGETARAFGRAGVDGLLVAETPRADGPERDGDVRDTTVELLDVLDNIGEFFGTALAFAPAGYAASTVTAIAEAATLDALFLDAPDHAVDVDDVRVGAGLTPSVLAHDDDEVERLVRDRIAECPPDGFLASGVEVPPDVHPRKLQAAHRGATAAPN